MRYNLFKILSGGGRSIKQITENTTTIDGKLLVDVLLADGWKYNANFHPELSRLQGNDNKLTHAEYKAAAGQKNPEKKKLELTETQHQHQQNEKKVDAVVDVKSTINMTARNAVKYLKTLSDADRLIAADGDTRKTVIAAI